MRDAQLFQDDAPIVEEPVRGKQKAGAFEVFHMEGLLAGSRMAPVHPRGEPPLPKRYSRDAHGRALRDDLFDGTIRHEVPDIDRAVEEGIGDRLPRDGMKLDIDVRMVFG